MANTRTKLNEAMFFYKLLKENNKVYPDFNYFLNAFLNSARAVTWIMVSEYDKIDGFKEWYKNQKVDDETKILLDDINVLRVQSTKKEPVQANPVAQFNIDENSITDEVKERLKEINKKKVTITISTDDEEPKEGDISIKGRISGIINSVKEFPNEDIINKCEKYIKELDQLVGECEKQFEHLLPQATKKRPVINFTNGNLLL
ncbi:hypothetical protein [Lysinibacillus sphaericus]|uniref:hypothetical protein n=1 Tax=Lysinibacillus sphaericus TaxID=1421 RepID=UPI00056C1AA8|nr:hypothetical protein [Lysinibacillus sphaericus]